jgi:hypothetical protein
LAFAATFVPARRPIREARVESPQPTEDAPRAIRTDPHEQRAEARARRSITTCPDALLRVEHGQNTDSADRIRRLLARTFAMDVLSCPKCQVRMRLLAMVQDPANVACFLAETGEATEVLRRSGRAGLSRELRCHSVSAPAR